MIPSSIGMQECYRSTRINEHQIYISFGSRLRSQARAQNWLTAQREVCSMIDHSFFDANIYRGVIGYNSNRNPFSEIKSPLYLNENANIPTPILVNRENDMYNTARGREQMEHER